MGRVDSAGRKRYTSITMTLKILILEDDPMRIDVFRDSLSRHKLFFVHEAANAIALIKSEVEAGDAFDVIFLDHDLGGETFVDYRHKNTGSEVVRWIRSYGGVLNQPYIIIHSMNTVEAMNMERGLVSHGLEFVYHIPFSRLMSHYLNDPSFLSR